MPAIDRTGGFPEHNGANVTYNWRKLRRLFIHNVLHADDTPHRIALGLAIGIFIGLTPTVGFQMVIAVAAALRANKVVCIPMVWITNPVTLIPIYALCHKLGAGLLGTSAATPGAAEHISDPMRQVHTFGLTRLFEFAFWKELSLGLTRAGAELWVGCLFAGFIAAAVTYLVSRRGVTAYRVRRNARIQARALRRSARQFTRGIRAREPTA